MSDLIRREDVMLRVREFIGNKSYDELMLVNDLNALPSAEPEPEEFEWCTNCKEYDQEKHCCHRWTKVIRRTVEEMKTNWRWIPVDEALPKDGQAVLCTVKGYPEGENWTITGCRYKDGVWETCEEAAYDYWTELSDVLAWMPLPESYKGD